ncbi:MAG: hypothetical protein WCI20_07430 [bacterium]
MSDDTKLEEGGIPPRVTIKVPGQSGEVVSAGAGKKKTTRIALDQVSAESGAVQGAHVESVGVASKTIRLAPVVTSQTAVTPLPSIGKALSGNFSPDDGKRQTSRIPLEAIFPGMSQSGTSGMPSSIPKTIKVKRPMISLSPKMDVATAGESVQVVSEPSSSVSAKSQTARVDVVPDTAPEAQQTQKKTIKIRRADGDPSAAEPRSVSIARSGEDSAMATSNQVARPHGVFIGVAAAALMVLGFMIYVLAAQAYPSLGWSL